jgi:SAM-dependent methyltransferase
LSPDVTPSAPDPDGLLYAEHWEPVLVAPSGRLIERLEERLGGGVPAVILDVGSGTGSLALAAAERWPDAGIVGLDASVGMLSVARHRAGARWRELDGRFRWHAADAAAMPLGDASIDLAVSSFVLQLVDDRRAVLREIGRVLRPDGLLGFVTWLRDDAWMAPDAEFDEAVYDLELEDPEGDARGSTEQEYESPEEAAADLAATGFTGIEVRLDTLEFGWQRADYLAFKVEYDERDLLDSLTPTDRARVLASVEERWTALPDDAFILRAPLVSATACRPG